ncbi:VanZ family protein [Peribacillus castrilensis]|uniref:VanZ family protein n=1 Tax=Peribacillus simplex TaxID=1478 RepID=A0AAN2PG61_9BACI|nr:MULTISPECIES: VanZ family protein [Peribacillus]MCP1152533.1 VanZ family protein [Peribacillus frigoritolerans]MEA3576918.1 VanZ family protein [Peribacillus frigoritolerans]CEG31953.1 VanZ family protein [Peribacillus simplex]
MILALYPSVIIVSLSIIILIFPLVKRRISILKFLYILLFIIYICSLIGITIFPFPVQKYFIETMIEDQLGLKHNFIPFKIFYDAMSYGSLSFGLTILLKQVVGNIILFLPMGFVLPMIFTNLQTIRKVIFIGFFASLSIELFQALAGLWIGYNYRAADIDDLIFNVLGTVIGFLIWKLLYQFLNKNNLIIVSK